VFFVGGCNFRCGFCHNAALLASAGETVTWRALHDACRRFADAWVDAAVISGGEPTLREDLPELIGFLRRFGWAVKLDTNGSRPEMLERCLEQVDYVAMDIKTAPADYPLLTGWEGRDAIAESVRLIRAKARDYEFRTTLIDEHHTHERMIEIASLLKGSRRFVVQPFVPRDGLPDPAFEALARTPADKLSAVGRQFAPLVDDVRVRGA
jgi:pyruvate formate lyase activating enzyme